MRTLDQIIGSLPPERRAKVMARTQKLIAEEMALRRLREARDLTQESMANMLHIDQAGVSKIERRSDMLLSTLRSFVKAMGGSLRLIAEFPDGVAELSSLGEALDIASERSAKRNVKPRAPRRRPELVKAEPRAERHVRVGEAVDRYREYARKCTEIARMANSPESKRMLLALADTWLKLAEQQRKIAKTTASEPELAKLFGLHALQ